MSFRVIFHVDMDAFFAAIEVARNPQLRDKAVIIGGDPNSRGVVSTCSYEARAFGVRSAMPTAEAKKRCPHGIFLHGDLSLYSDTSKQIMEIIRTYTYMVQVVSIDEAYVDMTGLGNDVLALGRELKQKIYDETSLTCSIGIATNKLTAKVASSNGKPDGLFAIPPGKEAAFLATLPVGSIPGIGKKTEASLLGAGIKTIAQLQQIPLDVLIDRFGARGYNFYLAARGRDSRPVEWQPRVPKSIGAETTFARDEKDKEVLREVVEGLAAKSHRRLLKHKMRARGVTLKLRDCNFRTINRSQMLLSHSNNEEVFREALLKLFERNYHGTLPLRLVGVTLEGLTSGYWQPLLWE